MIFIILILTYLLSLSMTGDPAAQLFPLGTPREVVEAYREKHGLDKPWYIQFLIYIKNFFQGDLGQSAIVSPNQPVLEYIGEVFPTTIELALIPMFLNPYLGLKLGAICY